MRCTTTRLRAPGGYARGFLAKAPKEPRPPGRARALASLALLAPWRELVLDDSSSSAEAVIPLAASKTNEGVGELSGGGRRRQEKTRRAALPFCASSSGSTRAQGLGAPRVGGVALGHGAILLGRGWPVRSSRVSAARRLGPRMTKARRRAVGGCARSRGSCSPPPGESSCRKPSRRRARSRPYRAPGGWAAPRRRRPVWRAR
jgi:hypothetical protein